MATKSELLELLENNRGKFFSGEEIAERLKVTRTSVWKAVKSLQKEGYEIEGISNKGYCMSARNDILSEQGIGKYLDKEGRTLDISVFSEVTSTNALVRDRANEGAPEGTVIIAAAQTAGRGRRGRSFLSPKDTGIYLSILLRPSEMNPEKAVKITTIAAVSACEAIEAVTKQKAYIKWVNDIFMNNKKVSGILTEASLSMETGKLDYVIMGIGINVYAPKGGFPDELKDIAGSVLTEDTSDAKNRISAEFLNKFMAYYRNAASDYELKYKNRSLALGKWVEVLHPEGSRRAFVTDINSDCHLLVRYEDDSTEELSTGEISIKLQ